MLQHDVQLNFKMVKLYVNDGNNEVTKTNLF